MEAMTSSASLQFVIILVMAAFSADFCQGIDNPTEGICNTSNDNSVVCREAKGLKFSNVSMAGSITSTRTSSSSTPSTKTPSSTPATKSPTRGGTIKSPPSSNDGSDDSTKSMASPFVVARPSLQVIFLVFSFISFLFFVYSA